MCQARLKVVGMKKWLRPSPCSQGDHKEGSAEREKDRAGSDGAGRYFLFYGVVRAGFSEEKTLEQKPEGRQ